MFMSVRVPPADVHCSACSMSVHTDMSVAMTEQSTAEDMHGSVNKLGKCKRLSGSPMFPAL